jgi:tetratricopeptide (TPR) repeat protein
MIEQRLPLGRQWQSIARFAANECEWRLAIAAMRLCVDDNPDQIERHLELANVLSLAGRPAEVIDHITRMPRELAQSAASFHTLGIAQIETGDAETGIPNLRRALNVRPQSGATWVALTGSKRLEPGGRDWEELARLYKRKASLPVEDRAAVCYAFGKALADAGEYDRAFESYSGGASLIALQRPYDVLADREAALHGLRKQSAIPLFTDDEPSRIFVTGKPRSGTTLVQQLLTAHPDIHAGGELNTLGACHRWSGIYPSRRGAFRSRYLHLLKQRLGTSRGIVDKSLNTSRFCGAIAAALPAAPMIWVRRDPLDTAWSSFRTFFAYGLGWTFDLKALAEYHATEDMLHYFWSREYGSNLLTLEYSELIQHPEKTVQRIIQHCGLRPSDKMLSFYAQERTVQTASVEQVRSPLNTAGLGSSAPYERFMDDYQSRYDISRKSLGF